MDWTYEIVSVAGKIVVKLYKYKIHKGTWSLSYFNKGRKLLETYLTQYSEDYKNCLLIARDELIDRGLIDG